MARAKRRRSIEAHRAMLGRMFVLPFTIGFLLLFLKPVLTSLYYSFANVSFDKGLFDVTFRGLYHYEFALTKDSEFLILLADAFKNMALSVPVILLFSMFIAMVLNQKFRGRGLMRAVFFLPVIITSGVIISILQNDIFNQTIQQANNQSTALFQATGLMQMLTALKIPASVIDTLTGMVNTIFDMLWRSGVQILIFLAAMQGVPPQLYEAARIEGATAWESYWKITFPMISPLLFTCLVYTIIDTFTDYSNPLMLNIQQMAFTQMRYAYACAMAWIYFVLVFLVILIVNWVFGKFVFYYND